jgi:hypothetical protein
MKTLLATLFLTLAAAIIVHAGSVTETIYNPQPGVSYPASAITTNCNITGWTITSDQVGSVTILPLKNGNPLPGPNILNPWKKITMTNSTSATGTFTNVSVLATDTIGFQVQSVSGVKKVQIVLTTTP